MIDNSAAAENLAVVIPAFNEASTIAEIAESACKSASTVIVVDDASRDGTVKALENVPVILQVHESNQGKAAALWTGIQCALDAGATAVITLDGDGQHDPSDIDSLVAAYRSHPEALIIAARHWGRESAPPLRRTANRIADFWVGWAAGTRLYDSQSGFRIYPRSLLETLAISTDRGRNFVFESEVLIESNWLGYRCIAVPIRSSYPTERRASHYKPVKDTYAIIIMVAIRLLRKGMNPVGLLRSLFGVVKWA